MFGSRTLLFLGMLAIGTAIDPNNICVLVSDGTKIVDDTSCSSYYTCKGGKATAVACQSGYSFDKDVKGCMPSSQVTCGNVVENPCAGVEDKKFVTNPESCRAYFYCLNGAISHSGSCSEDYYFDEKTQLCDYKSNVACSVTGGTETSDNPNLLCAYIPNGMFFGSASSCKAWSKCTNNLINHGECKDSFVFNVQTASCDYPTNYDCQQLEGDAGETGTNNQCSVPDAIKQNDKSCSSYLKCSKNEWVVVNCPTGLYYEPETGVCKNRNEAVTYEGCNRCEGTNLDFANQVGDGCTGYIRCKNGVQGTDGVCGAGYFFNENFGHCVNENPAFRFCLKECTDCDATTSDTVNSCNANCNDVTCDCTCIKCALPKCSSCLVSDKTQTNKCNTPSCEDNESCECACDACVEQILDCPIESCVKDGAGDDNKCNSGCEALGNCGCNCVTCEKEILPCGTCTSDNFDQINTCNTPLCGDDESCQCTCEECDPLPECDVNICEDGVEGDRNKCNSGCLDTDDCECTCLTCKGDLEPCGTCTSDNFDEINKCNTPLCGDEESCQCTCDVCTGGLTGCPAENCVIGGTGDPNKCNSECEDDSTCECICDVCSLPDCPTENCVTNGGGDDNKCNSDCVAEDNCACTCDLCDNLEDCAEGECNDDDELPKNMCNDSECLTEETCECFCGICE